MIEIPWLIIPNLVASGFLTCNKAFMANLIYCFGYLLLIWHNIQIGDSPQMIYFSLLEIMSIVGVFYFLYINRKTLKKRLCKNE
jgi:ABC-type Fe3+-siderophore transport system permease subunit